MESIEKKLTILSKIAEELNARGVTWAVGASLLLYFKGIVTAFNDIDLMISEEDYEAAKEIRIPLQSLEDWRHYYQLMGRTEKVRLIEASQSKA